MKLAESIAFGGIIAALVVAIPLTSLLRLKIQDSPVGVALFIAAMVAGTLIGLGSGSNSDSGKR